MNASMRQRGARPDRDALGRGLVQDALGLGAGKVGAGQRHHQVQLRTALDNPADAAQNAVHLPVSTKTIEIHGRCTAALRDQILVCHMCDPPAPLPMPAERAFFSDMSHTGMVRRSVQSHLCRIPDILETVAAQAHSTKVSRSISGTEIQPAVSSRRPVVAQNVRDPRSSHHFPDSSFVAYEWGLVPCMEHCRSASKRRAKSSERSCRAMHECAGRLLESSARRCGRSRLRKNSLRASAARFEPPLMSFQASGTLRHNRFSSLSERSRLLSNDRSAA